MVAIRYVTWEAEPYEIITIQAKGQWSYVKEWFISSAAIIITFTKIQKVNRFSIRTGWNRYGKDSD